MKKFIRSIITAFVITATLVSCEKDDKETTDDSTILGKWEVTTATLSSPGEDPITVNPNEPCEVKAYFDLKAEGIAEMGDLDTEDCEITKVAGEWTKTGNTMEMTSEGETEVATVISLTSNTMVLKTMITDSEYPEGSYMQATFVKKQ